MPVLRLGAAQLHYHPAFEGGGKQPLREPLGTWEGAGLSGLRAGTEEGERLLRALREQVEKAYVEAFRPRLVAVVRFAAALELDLLVLPELSVPPALLPAVAEAAGERRTVVAGTHLRLAHLVDRRDEDSMRRAVDPRIAVADRRERPPHARDLPRERGHDRGQHQREGQVARGGAFAMPREVVLQTQHRLR
jgi:hypothetical protein